jgi:AraC-like DNA-binding protein
MRYVMQWRLHLAAHRLRERQQSIAQVAALIITGYDSEAAFNRAFKRYMGQPPAAWRNKRLSDIEMAHSPQ